MRKTSRSIPRLATSRAGARRPLACSPHPLDVVYATLTLESHFGGRVSLRALSTFRKGSSYYRRVLLVQEYSARPVEMGAVRIDLMAFKPRIRSQILSNRVPLGRLLRDGGVDYKSRPTVFLAVTPNSEMMGVFWMREPRLLYGRQTEMSIDGRKVGDVVEILPLV